ncbi:MAG TPA: DHA2 family efflux MFS transporter permease subunit [Xanthobacteraceae bacterium]
MLRQRIVPLIVAVALFMEQMDSTVITTALPAIAADIGTSPLALKLAITSYLLALAIFIPASGWTADRFGARTVFRLAIAIFVCGSIACAFAQSLSHFVLARFLQGIGGAMMTPVGRLVLLRTVDKRELVEVMAWVTMPGLIGPLIGPPLGGFITTYFSWQWIFLINVPIGIAGIAFATRFVPNVRAEEPARFDFLGMLLAGLGIGGLAFGLTVASLDYWPPIAVAALIAGGAAASIAYVVHARRSPAPILDLSLLAVPTFRASVLGGFIFRVGAGALPFLMPLLLQLGFNMTPFQSGLITFSSALAAMTMKAAAPIILRAFGFRSTLIVNALLSAVSLAACAAFTPNTPIAVIVAVLVIGGFFRSLQFTCVNTIAYADIDQRRMSRATSLVSVGQQVSMSTGVATGALLVEITMRWRHGTVVTAADFPLAFVIVAVIAAAAVGVFLRLRPEAGAELARRTPGPTETADQRMG